MSEQPEEQPETVTAYPGAAGGGGQAPPAAPDEPDDGQESGD